MAYPELPQGTTTIPTPATYDRVNPAPLDRSSIFTSFEGALDYARTAYKAYVGQMIAVFGVDKCEAYVISKIGHNAVLSSMGGLNEDEYSHVTPTKESNVLLTNKQFTNINDIDQLINFQKITLIVSTVSEIKENLLKDRDYILVMKDTKVTECGNFTIPAIYQYHKGQVPNFVLKYYFNDMLVDRVVSVENDTKTLKEDYKNILSIINNIDLAYYKSAYYDRTPQNYTVPVVLLPTINTLYINNTGATGLLIDLSFTEENLKSIKSMREVVIYNIYVGAVSYDLPIGSITVGNTIIDFKSLVNTPQQVSIQPNTIINILFQLILTAPNKYNCLMIVTQ